jgi:methionyl-tRNA formyltransferase
VKLLFLGPAQTYQLELIHFLKNNKCSVTRYNKKLNDANGDYENYNLLISYGYRFIISEKILSLFLNRAINLHISYLPWNKGADPNLWSFLDDTPKGVTIHQINKGIDTGHIFFQEKIIFNKNDTLKTSYDKLNKLIIDLFKTNWPLIKNNKANLFKQSFEGTYHRKRDKKKFENLLDNKWDTKVTNLIGKGKNV